MIRPKTALQFPHPPADPSKMEKRSVIIAGHRTSVSVENAYWDEFKTIARTRGVNVNQLVTDIDSRRAGNLSSAIRLFVLDVLQRQAKAGS